jgi:hypothetical protein
MKSLTEIMQNFEQSQFNTLDLLELFENKKIDINDYYNLVNDKYHTRYVELPFFGLVKKTPNGSYLIPIFQGYGDAYFTKEYDSDKVIKVGLLWREVGPVEIKNIIERRELPLWQIPPDDDIPFEYHKAIEKFKK